MRSLQIPPEAESELCNDPFDNLSTTSELHNASNPRSLSESIWGMGGTSINKRKGLDLLVQPCESSCIKAVLQNQSKFHVLKELPPFQKYISSDAKIVFRGCLTSVYQQISARDYFFSMVCSSVFFLVCKLLFCHFSHRWEVATSKSTIPSIAVQP